MELLMAEQLLRPMLASSATRCKELTRLALVLLIGVPLTSNAAKVPAHFQSYATTNVGGGLSCVVGATSDSEHSNERAYVYIEDSKTHTLRWIASIPLHAGWYQNRASHRIALRSGRRGHLRSHTIRYECHTRHVADSYQHRKAGSGYRSY